MKTIFFFIAIMVCQQTLRSQDETPDYFLWKVSMNGSEFTLAGSVHAGKQDLFPPPVAYLNAYKQADKAIFEIKDDAETMQKRIFNYAEKYRLEEGQQLDKLISNEAKETLSVLFDGKEDILAQYYQYEGWLLNMVVNGRQSLLIGYNPELSIDMYFHNLAIKDKKKIIGLDAIETQLELFYFDVPLQTQVKIIETSIKRAEQQALAELPLFENYYNHDPDGFREVFLRLMNLENPQMKSIYDRIFISRNQAWVKKLIELSSSQPGNYFVLVGSGHYFGPDNILELIKAEGYGVIPYVEK